MIIIGRLLLILVCILPISLFGKDDIDIVMSLSRDAINIDESVYLKITISGSQRRLPSPQLPNLSIFDVYPRGTSANLLDVNGKVEVSLKTYNYLLQPKQEGTFVIKPAVVVVHNRRRYESNEVTLKVIGSGGAVSEKSLESQATTKEGKARDLFLTAEVDKKSAYVSEQITLSVKFFQAVKLYSQPDYTPPQTTDFWADILEPQKTYEQIVNDRRYKVIEINTALFPTRSGELTIGQAMVSVVVASKERVRRNDPFSSMLRDFFRGRDPIFNDFFRPRENVRVRVRSNPIKVQVLPLPEENKPRDFSGTVGSFRILSTPDKTTVEANQPVTVTYKISGTGNIKTIAEPAIRELKDFRVYRASSSEKISKLNGIIGGAKIFEEVYIPKRAGKLTIPPVKLDFFDPGLKKYIALSTKPVLLNVKPVAEGEFADIPFRPITGRIVDPNAKDIRFIKTEVGDLVLKKPLIIFRPLYLIMNALPMLMLIIVWISQKRKEKFAADVGYARSRTARRMAKKRLSAARKLVGSQQPAQFYSEIRAAILSYVADKLNISPYGLTSEKLLDLIRNAGAKEELISAASELLRRADFAQYSSVEVSQQQIMDSLNMAEKILIGLEEINLA